MYYRWPVLIAYKSSLAASGRQLQIFGVCMDFVCLYCTCLLEINFFLLLPSVSKQVPNGYDWSMQYAIRNEYIIVRWEDLVTAAAARPNQLGVMALTVDVAGFVTVAHVHEQLLTAAASEAGRVPRGLGGAVWRRSRHDHRRLTRLDVGSASSARLDISASSSCDSRSYIHRQLKSTFTASLRCSSRHKV